MEKFYNPYAFIPLSDYVHFLSCEEEKQLLYVQDVPFSDGVSGAIEVNFLAKTPICIKNEKNGENSKIKGQYFIPATSIKGMIRNVFEIITHSNIKTGVANNRYSMRDMRSPDYKLKSNEKEQKSGFMIKLNQQLFIVACPNDTYTYKEICEYEDINDTELFKKKDVKGKYDLLKNSHIIEDEENDYWMWFFSGFMNNKEHERLFKIPMMDDNTIMYPIEKEEYEDFIFIHEKENENRSWRFWKEKLKNYDSIQDVINDQFKGIVPCFFRIKDNDSGKKVVRDLGFAYLYRQPYDKTIHDCLPDTYNSVGIDMVRAVFGYTEGKEALKGRVQFSNVFIADGKKIQEQIRILGSPKPTYYPFYLKQDKYGQLNTYFTKNVQIAGWKRSLVHKEAQLNSNSDPKRKKVETSFIPLESGTSFTAKINFHNLRPYELGALLSAITFVNNHDKCFHSIGFAKPFGFGKLKVESINLKLADQDNLKSILDYQNDFFNKLGKGKIMDNSVNELIRIASGNYKPFNIRYPILNNKEFETIKNEKKSLKDFNP